MSDPTAAAFAFPSVRGRKLTAAFDGGRLTSDGGVLLLAQAARRLGIAEKLAAVIPDGRETARKEECVPKLDPRDGYVVLINTFTVKPARADELLAELSQATEGGMSKRPGFVSANLHVSMDRRHVANYAQWRSRADIDAMMKDPVAQDHMKKAAIATSFEPIYYELRETHPDRP